MRAWNKKRSSNRAMVAGARDNLCTQRGELRCPPRRLFARANAVIEMAIVLPVLSGMALGLAEFGQFFYVKNAFECAARDVARVAIGTLAQQGDPAARATVTFAQSNITFQPSWMTITDDATNTTVTDITTVFAGDAITVTIKQNYDQLPGIYRPLFQMTGKGIGNGKVVMGKCTAIRE